MTAHLNGFARNALELAAHLHNILPLIAHPAVLEAEDMVRRVTRRRNKLLRIVMRTRGSARGTSGVTATLCGREGACSLGMHGPYMCERPGVQA